MNHSFGTDTVNGTAAKWLQEWNFYYNYAAIDWKLMRCDAMQRFYLCFKVAIWKIVSSHRNCWKMRKLYIFWTVHGRLHGMDLYVLCVFVFFSPLFPIDHYYFIGYFTFHEPVSHLRSYHYTLYYIMLSNKQQELTNFTTS